MSWCQDFLTEHLKDYNIYRDQKRNLIACPVNIDLERDIIYLSAHLDTVDADPLEWDEPFSPFTLYEDKTQMVARGVSDCKAGVAFELFLAKLLSTQQITLSNLIFTITFKEEGAGLKTSRQIGEDLGHKLPISKKDTFFIVLENNVTVSDPSVLSYYTSERGNFVIRISDTLDNLRSVLARLNQWNPVSIRPENDQQDRGDTILTQKGGHVCSVSREENRLTHGIAESLDTDLLWAGDESGFAVIPSQIFKHHTNVPVMHYLVLSNRSFDTNADIYAQLDGIIYEEVKDFSISQGMNFDQIFSKHYLSGILNTYQKKRLRTQQTHNVGASDATIVTRCMNPKHKQRLYPIVMGPGTRSQRDKLPPRLTHGKNETFDKQSGKAAVECLLSVLTTLGTIKPDLRI
jgi:Peptidase family M20/M25/M40